MRAPTLREIRQARDRIAGAVHRTPLLSSRTLSEDVGAEVLLKAEHLQKTGSFKPRGALNFMLGLDEDARARGVVTISAGNHAQAVAWAAALAGVPATVVMPESAPEAKVRASRAYGAAVVLRGDVFEAFDHALELGERDGLTFVHPFDDPRIVAGQATVALEIVEARPDVRDVVVPIGGGGLCAGICAGLAEHPGIRVWGVEPEGAAGMHASLAAGEAVRLEAVETLADGLGAPMAGELPFEVVRARAEGVVLVSDAAIARAMRRVLERTKQLVEPGGAAGVAALLEGCIPAVAAGPVVAVLSGGNVDVERLGPLFEVGAGGGSVVP